MNIQYHKHYSGCLNREMEFKVYGHAGKPVMFIPCQGGRFMDFEGFNMHHTWAPWIESGQVMVFSIDCIDNEAWAAKGADNRWRIYARNPIMPPHFVSSEACVAESMVTEGCEVYGKVTGSVLFAGVTVEEDAIVEESVIMPGTTVKAGAVVRRSIVAENCVITKGCVVGDTEGDIALIGQDTVLPEGYKVNAGEQIDMSIIAGKEAE